MEQPPEQRAARTIEFRRRIEALRLVIPAVEELARGLPSTAAAAPAAVLKPPPTAPLAPIDPAPAAAPSGRAAPSDAQASAQEDAPLAQREKRPARARQALLALGTSTLLVGLAWAGLLRLRAQAQVHRLVSLPTSSSAGLALREGVAYTADPASLVLFAIDLGTGRVRKISKFEYSGVSGLAWCRDCLWSADAEMGNIYQHHLDGTYSIRRIYANPERRPQSLYWDGKSLWVGDAATETVFRYAVGGRLEAVQQFALPGLLPSGLHVSDEMLWVLDGRTRKVYRYRRKALPVLVDVLETDRWLAAASRLTGMVVHGDELWIAAAPPGVLHRFDWKRLPRTKAPPGPLRDYLPFRALWGPGSSSPSWIPSRLGEPRADPIAAEAGSP